MVDLVSLRDCPPGLFRFGKTIGFKTEYRGMETVGPIEVPGDQVRWIVGNHSDAYVVETGESFWGGAPSRDARDALMVEPVDLASHPCKSGEGAETSREARSLIARLLDHADYDEDFSDGLRQHLRDAARLLALTPDATQTREAEGVEAFGAAMFQRIWDSFTDEGWEIEINDLVTVEAVKAGLVSVTPFDPEVHSDQSGSAEPGDDFYEVTQAGRAALSARDAA